MTTPSLMESAWLIVAILLPLVMACALAVKRLSPFVRALAALAALPALGLALAGPTGSALEIPWLLKHTLLLLDQTARVFLGFTSALYLAAAWYAHHYLRNDPAPTRFFVLLLAAMSGNFTLILAGDIATFYVGFALMGLASAGLVLHRGDDEARRAGRMYLALAMVGEVLLFAGFMFLVVHSGTTQIAALHSGAPDKVGLVLLLAGFGIKAGALTLHFWLPLAHPAAPVPASAVLSGAMIKAGLLGWMRFLPLGETTLTLTGGVLIGAGLGAAFLGTLVGVVQRNPKAVLAYSSISQMGIITTGLGIGALRPEAWPEIQVAVLIYATHHALSKGALFLGVGPAHEAQTPRQRMLARAGLLLPACALAGAPFTSGALAKVALKSNITFLPEPVAVTLSILLPLAAVGTTLKMARFLWLTWPRSTAAGEEDAGPALGSRSADSGAGGLWAPWLFLVGAVLAGVWLLPGAWGWLPAKFTPQKLWLATWPLLVGAGLAVVAARLRHDFSGKLSRWLPAGDMGVFLEKLLTRLQPKVEPATRSEDHHDHPDDADEPAQVPSVHWNALAHHLAGLEERLRAWPVAGTALLVLLGLLLWSLTESTR